MTKKPDDKSSAILSFPQTQTERTKMRNRAECGDRIRAYRKARELSQPQLAAMLGITKNSITNWETGVSRPELSMIPKLCQALGITTDAFFDMPAGRQTLSKAEQEHMRLYRSLDAYRQRTVNTLMESMIENDLLAFRDGCVNEFSYLGREELPSSAGTGTLLTDTYEHEHVFLRNSRNVCRADTVITVSGDSMTPTFHNGDELLVEFTQEIDPGEIGIFVIAGESFVKEYQPDGLHSHNPKYKTIHPGPDDNFRCAGRVLGVVTQDMYPTAQELDVLNEVYSKKHKR